MRQESNAEIIEQYVRTLNERFLRPEKHYDSDTKKYAVGCFYLKQGYGKRGVSYEIREVDTEEGEYTVLGNQDCSSEQLLFWIDGFMSGHYATCALLGYSLEDNVNNVVENTTDEFETEKSIEEGKDEIEFVDEDGNPLSREDLLEEGAEADDVAFEDEEQAEG